MTLAVCLGCYFIHADAEKMREVVNSRLAENPVLWTQRLLNSILMATIAKHCPSRLHEIDAFDLFKDALARVRSPLLSSVHALFV